MAETASAKQLARSLFRTFVREQRLGSLLPTALAVRRKDPLAKYVRHILEDESDHAATVAPRRLENITVLLRSARVHNELLARYNPVYGKSEQERIKATANRVGLDVPAEFANAAGQGVAGEPSIDAKYRS